MLPNSRIATHTGTILEEEFLRPLRLTQADLARALHIPVNRVNEMVGGKRGITPQSALLLAAYFGNSPEFWDEPSDGSRLVAGQGRDARERDTRQRDAKKARPPRREIQSAQPARTRRRLTTSSKSLTLPQSQSPPHPPPAPPRPHPAAGTVQRRSPDK